MTKQKDFKDRFIEFIMGKKVNWVSILFSFLGYIFGIYLASIIIKNTFLSSINVGAQVILTIVAGFLVAMLFDKLSDKM